MTYCFSNIPKRSLGKSVDTQFAEAAQRKKAKGGCNSTSALRLLPLRGLRTLRVRRVALQTPGVTHSNQFGICFLLYKYCKQRLTNNFSNGSENIIFEIYSTKNRQPLEASL